MDETIRRHARALGAYMAARMSGKDGRKEKQELERIEKEIGYENKD